MWLLTFEQVCVQKSLDSLNLFYARALVKNFNNVVFHNCLYIYFKIIINIHTYCLICKIKMPFFIASERSRTTIFIFKRELVLNKIQQIQLMNFMRR